MKELKLASVNLCSLRAHINNEFHEREVTKFTFILAKEKVSLGAETQRATKFPLSCHARAIKKFILLLRAAEFSN